MASFLSFLSASLNKPTSPTHSRLSQRSSTQTRPANIKKKPILSSIHTQLSSQCFLIPVHLSLPIPDVKCIPKMWLVSYVRARLSWRCFPSIHVTTTSTLCSSHKKMVLRMHPLCVCVLFGLVCFILMYFLAGNLSNVEQVTGWLACQSLEVGALQTKVWFAHLCATLLLILCYSI